MGWDAMRWDGMVWCDVVWCGASGELVVAWGLGCWKMNPIKGPASNRGGGMGTS